jgi:hypothetical protein
VRRASALARPPAAARRRGCAPGASCAARCAASATLGVAAERESEVLAGLVAAAEDTGARTAELTAAVADLRREAARLADLNAERQDLLAAIHDVTTRQATLTARLGGYAVRQDALEEGLLAHSHGLLEVETRLAHPTVPPAPTPATATDRRADDPDPAPSATPAAGGLDAARLTALLAALDAALPALAAGSAVAVTAHGPQAAELRQAAAVHFGARFAAPDAPTRRFPNDAWLHLDLAPPGERPILLANAAGRLGRRGLFVWVGAPADAALHHPQLRPVATPDLGDLAGAGLRVRIWEKV